MTQAHEKDSQRPERISERYQELVNSFDSLQKHHVNQAEKCGWARDVCRDNASQFVKIPDHSSLAYTEEALIKYSEYIRMKESQTKAQYIDITSPVLAISTSTAVISVAALGNIRPSPVMPKLIDSPPWRTPEMTRRYADRLEKLRPGLGKSLLSVWQNFHALTLEPERAALTSMRELFNQFIEVLAPDDKVRASGFFALKKGNKKDEVHRRERLLYAVNVNVKDKQTAGMLTAQIDLTLKAYDDLNELHRRGGLDHDDVARSLNAVQAFFEQIIDAIGL